MAKFVKADREIIDIDDEVKKLSNEIVGSKKVEKRDSNKKNTTKKAVKKNTKKDNKKNTKKTNKKKFTFFKEVKSEVSKVKCPSKKDMIKYSVATIVFIVFFALFFYLIDLIIALLKAGV